MKNPLTLKRLASEIEDLAKGCPEVLERNIYFAVSRDGFSDGDQEGDEKKREIWITSLNGIAIANDDSGVPHIIMHIRDPRPSNND